MPVRSISQLRQIGRETDCELDIEDCICIGETQDFYHGCLAAIDFALSLAGEKYAYAQISLVKTNAANFIELNKDCERRVLELKGLSSSKRQDWQPKQNLLVELSQVDGDNQVGTLGSEGEGDETDSRSTKTETLEAEQEQELKSDHSDSSELIVPLALSNPAILKYQNESEEGVGEQFTEEVVKLPEEERLELENLLSRTLLDGCQQLKLGKRKVIELEFRLKAI